ncbi:MAG: thiamine-phosphate kinase [Candidatus Heimdallarchaeaceae archaeon]
MKKVSNEKMEDVGERAFLKRIRNLVDESLLPFNEDASAVLLPSGEVMVINVDMLVFKTDVLPGMSFEQVGKKAVTMSVSDIIAKGAKPHGCLASLGLKSDTKTENAQSILKGVREQCSYYGAKFLGGDLNESSDIVLDVVSFGVCEKEDLLLRKGAKDGDLLFSTGLFGLTSLGYKLLLENQEIPADLEIKVLTSVFEPKAKMEYLDLLKTIPVSSCMDSSDGLLITLKELSDINNMGIDVTNVPIDSQVESFIDKIKQNPLDLTFSGGEEFELIFSVSREFKEKLIKQARKNKLFLKMIGSFNKNHKNIIVTDKKFSMYNIPDEGFEHFK